jgi:hypothetical protein
MSPRTEPDAAADQMQAQLLDGIQRGLEGLYRLDPAPAVTDFLLPPGYSAGRHEQLVIVEAEELHLGLAIDFEAMTQLEADRVGPDNLPHFSLVVEGVSHFLHMMHAHVTTKQRAPSSWSCNPRSTSSSRRCFWRGAAPS